MKFVIVFTAIILLNIFVLKISFNHMCALVGLIGRGVKIYFRLLGRG